MSKVDAFLENEAKGTIQELANFDKAKSANEIKTVGTKIIGAHSIDEFVQKLKRPRKMMLLVRAGSAVDDLINELVPHLQPGDIIIDGGNSHFPDTIRRCQDLKAKQLLFIGCGVSGGEEGARYGPSLMPGGAPEAWYVLFLPLTHIH